MKLIGLDGKPLLLDVRQSQYPMRTESSCKSKIQYECGQLIKEKYPHDTILEEFTVPKHGIIIDFFLPVAKIAFEIQGRQHEEYVPFFHKSKKGFKDAVSRDSKKKEFCLKNDINYISVQSTEELRRILWKN